MMASAEVSTLLRKTNYLALGWNLQLSLFDRLIGAWLPTEASSLNLE
jgi:hypothetical protein